MTDDLVTWLRQQLDDDERVAHSATAGPWWHNPGKAWLDAEAFEQYDRSKGEEFVGYGESPFSGCVAATGPASHAQSMADAEHIARHDPARVLAEVAAKRRILDEHFEASLGDTGVGAGDCTTCTNYAWPCPTVRLLALPYADRPGYRPEWRP
ncbi:DUF6221 family protein [Micromonospora globbae]|uniref:DUF6221 family protein n=1 Tax=Micromonospora globbae TaxID=1894969 RepID=UPI00343B7353